MPKDESVCPRCDAQVEGDWSYCPQCSMMLSASQEILSDRIRYVRHEHSVRSRRTAVIRSLANLSVALSILFVVGSGIVLFHPAMVPRLFNPPDTFALEPLPPVEKPEESTEGAVVGTGFDWVPVPAGTFRSGHPERAKERNLAGFEILKYEVTNWQWQKFLERRKEWLEINYSFANAVPDHWGWDPASDTPPAPPTSQDYDKPVVNITWNEARIFCHEYLAKLPGCEGARLPTSLEWEKAARGNSDARLYPWGSRFLTVKDYVRCNCRQALLGAPVSVTVPPFADRDVSPYGVVGMGGNVAEFVNAAELIDYLVPGYRGGDYESDEFDVRVYLDSTTQGRGDVTFAFVGFRAIRPLPVEKKEDK